MPDADDLDNPAGFIDRVIGGDVGGIDEAIAELERTLAEEAANDSGDDKPETGGEQNRDTKNDDDA